ncbi:hypothetical protein O9G_006318, partial [Rozella allomycis CSF55]
MDSIMLYSRSGIYGNYGNPLIFLDQVVNNSLENARLLITKETIENRPQGSNKTWGVGTRSQKRYCEETKTDPVASTLNIINFAEWLKHTTKKNGGHYSANSIKSYTQATVDLNKL